MSNLFTAARERAALEAAMADYIAGGGKVTRLDPVYQPNQKPDLTPAQVNAKWRMGNQLRFERKSG